MRKRLFVLVMMFCMMLTCSQVYAASVGAMTDDNTYIDESGNVYTYQDDKVYQLVDGKLYEVVTGSSQSIIDVMKSKPGSEVPDAAVMGEATGIIGQTIGVALSVIIYVFFAMTAFTTACDLAYIGLPPVRDLLYDGSHIQGQMQHNHFGGQMNPGHGVQPHQAGAVADRPRSRCFISSDLKQLLAENQTGVRFPGMPQSSQVNPNIMLMYLKRRAISIVLIVVVFMLLVTSTVFTDFGLNVGGMLYRNVAKLLGA